MKEKILGYLNTDEIFNSSTKEKNCKDLGLDLSAVSYYKQKIKKSKKENENNINFFQDYWTKEGQFIKKCLFGGKNAKDKFEELTSFTFEEEEIKKLNIPVWLISIDFVLETPYFSKDDELFYFADNPIVKEKVFKMPMVRASTWKGKIHWVGIKLLIDQIIANVDQIDEIKDELIEKRLMLTTLFGHETKTVKEYLDRYFSEAEVLDAYQEYYEERIKGEQVKGTLNFYDSFFCESDLTIKYDVINKLDERTKTGKKPIFYEVVPSGTKSNFQLLYYPWRASYTETEKFFKELKYVFQMLNQLFFKYGFSAKGEGWGTIKKNYCLDIKTSHKKDYKDLFTCVFGGNLNE
ncbi:MAG: hypothetical protein KAX49_08265 [Halanaerobiales bacterium]|nr:hypothetical protein [Halanaerobiales bacterium]